MKTWEKRQVFLSLSILCYLNHPIIASASNDFGEQTEKSQVYGALSDLHKKSVDKIQEPLKTIALGLHKHFLKIETPEDIYDERTSTHFGFVNLSYNIPESVSPHIQSSIDKGLWRVDPSPYTMKHWRAKEDYAYERGLIRAEYMKESILNQVVLKIQIYWDKRERSLLTLKNAMHLWGQWMPSQLYHLPQNEVERFLIESLLVFAVDLLYVATADPLFENHPYVSQCRQSIWKHLIEQQSNARGAWNVAHKALTDFKADLAIPNHFESHDDQHPPDLKEVLHLLALSRGVWTDGNTQKELNEIGVRIRQLKFLKGPPSYEGLLNIFPKQPIEKNNFQFVWGQDHLPYYFARLRSLDPMQRTAECEHLLAFRYELIPSLLRLKSKGFIAASHPNTFLSFIEGKVTEEQQILSGLRKNIRDIAPPAQATPIESIPYFAQLPEKPEIAKVTDVSTIHRGFRLLGEAIKQPDLMLFLATSGISLFPIFHEDVGGISLEFAFDDEIGRAGKQECLGLWKRAIIHRHEKKIPACVHIYRSKEKTGFVEKLNLTRYAPAEKDAMLSIWHKYTMIYLKKYLFMSEKDHMVRFMDILQAINDKLVASIHPIEIELLGKISPKKSSLFKKSDHLTPEGYISFLTGLPRAYLMLLNYPKENVKFLKMTIDLTRVQSLDTFIIGNIAAIRDKDAFLSFLLIEEFAEIYLLRWQSQRHFHPFAGDNNRKLSRLLYKMLFKTLSVPTEPLDKFLKTKRAYFKNVQSTISDCQERFVTFQQAHP